MTERERLIELIKNGFFAKPVYEALCTNKRKASEYLADYLLENGVIVPPVKIGDTVYIKNEPHKVLYMMIENEISYCARFDCDEICSECSFAQKTAFNEFIMCKGEEYPEFKASDIGKTVFTNREAVEKVLKERENNANKTDHL